MASTVAYGDVMRVELSVANSGSDPGRHAADLWHVPVEWVLDGPN